MMLLLYACTSPTPDTGKPPAGADTQEDSQAGDSDTAPADTGPLELAVSAVQLTTTDPSEPHAIHIVVKAASQIEVIDSNFATGCCPEAEVTATADVDTMVVTPVYTLTGDTCGCETGLELDYVLTGLPTGWWTVTYGDTSQGADVP